MGNGNLARIALTGLRIATLKECPEAIRDLRLLDTLCHALFAVNITV
jgi:hypothetical protein